MKFRKKPVVIEAEQFSVATLGGDPGKLPPGVTVVLVDLNDGRVLAEYDKDKPHPAGNMAFGIKTIEGWHVVTDGDWIITGVKGERYPCKPDIFAATYEPA